MFIEWCSGVNKFQNNKEENELLMVSLMGEMQ